MDSISGSVVPLAMFISSIPFSPLLPKVYFSKVHISQQHIFQTTQMAVWKHIKFSVLTFSFRVHFFSFFSFLVFFSFFLFFSFFHFLSLFFLCSFFFFFLFFFFFFSFLFFSFFFLFIMFCFLSTFVLPLCWGLEWVLGPLGPISIHLAYPHIPDYAQTIQNENIIWYKVNIYLLAQLWIHSKIRT